LLFDWPVWVSVNIWVPYMCYFHVEIFIFLIFKYKIAYYIIVGTNVYNLLNCIYNEIFMCPSIAFCPFFSICFLLYCLSWKLRCITLKIVFVVKYRILLRNEVTVCL
jgi:hypothetical protein